jgi:diguanylate cyclase (GGDEF)-like protein
VTTSAAAEALSTQLLVQFLTAVSSCPDSASAARVAAERAAAALEAEVGAVVLDDLVATVGFPGGDGAAAALAAVARRETSEVEVPGVGACSALAAPLREAADGHLVVARSYAPHFTSAEVNLLRGMARAFHVALVSLRTLERERAMRELSERQARENERLIESLRTRHHLLERLVGVQRAITRRAPLEEVLGVVVDGAQGLLRDDVAVLALVDRDDPSRFLHVTARGLPPEAVAALRRSRPTSTDPAWAAVTTDRVVLARGPVLPAADSAADCGVRPRAALAAPVHEGPRTAGVLLVASADAERAYGTEDQAVLEAFAEQVSLALTDALTLAEMHRANHDTVTGLATRRLFVQRLDEALAGPPGSTVGVLFIDLDRFKMVNDTLGHQAGDQLLHEVGARIRACLREADSAARFGGDEFAVLLEQVDDVEGVVAVAERIGESIRRAVELSGRQVFVDASIGIVTAAPGSTDSEAMIRDADVAMYEAKKSGAGRAVVFDQGMRDRFERRVELESDLRNALARDELCLHYQPIVDLESGEVVAVEALLRWQRPGHGWVPPMSFIPVAEETGVILPLGEWVLREACRLARTWHDVLAGRAPVVAVNLSARQIAEPGLARTVAAVLAETGLPPDGLVLEITESVLMQDRELALERLTELKALGVGLAVDDFGTGYSSLTYLRGFPVDILKIDKAFVDDVADDQEAAQLARAIVELGRTLKLSTIAEGIERPEQRDVMRAYACTLGQGYLFSRPVDADALLAFLQAGGRLG